MKGLFPILLALMLPLGLATAQEPLLEVVELQHRPATSVIPVLRPLLQQGESVSGASNQLFLRVLPHNREALLSMVQRLDTAPRNLLISVRQGDIQSQQRRSAGISGRFPAGDGSIQIGNDPRPGGIRLEDSQRRGSNTSNQQLRVLEGHEGTIFVGQQIPISNPVIARDGRVLGQQTGFKTVSTGFVVLPRVAGDQVTLEISPQQQRLNEQGFIDSSGVSTQVSGRLGEWIDIGGAVQSLSGQSRGILQSGSQSGSRQNEIAVKVDPAP